MATIKWQSVTYFIIGMFILAFLFVALYGFGFKPKGETVINLGELKSYENNFNSFFIKTSFGLMVAGLALSGIPILATICLMIVLNFTNINLEDRKNVFQWIIGICIGLTILAVVLILAGELNFMIRFAKDDNKMFKKNNFSAYWDQGYAAGLLIFTLLPLPIIFIPLIKQKFKRN